MEYKIGEVFKHKGHYLMVKKGSYCADCFFNFEDYLYTNETKRPKICYRPTGLYCGPSSRNDNVNVYYKEISEIEYLILKGGKND